MLPVSHKTAELIIARLRVTKSPRLSWRKEVIQLNA